MQLNQQKGSNEKSFMKKRKKNLKKEMKIFFWAREKTCSLGRCLWTIPLEFGNSCRAVSPWKQGHVRTHPISLQQWHKRDATSRSARCTERYTSCQICSNHKSNLKCARPTNKCCQGENQQKERYKCTISVTRDKKLIAFLLY